MNADEEIHDPTQTRFPGHWRCTCGHVGTDDMMTIHLMRAGWCPDCWGSGSSPYWLDGGQGICSTCGGSGEVVDVILRDVRMAENQRAHRERITAERLDRRQVRV
jgi:hypothetical protein